MSPALHRPEPVKPLRSSPVDRETAPPEAALRLQQGETLVVRDHYRTGVEILKALEVLVPALSPLAELPEVQARRQRIRKAAMRLLVPVRDHQLALRGSASRGFLPELYPDQRDFLLPLVQLQELHGAWERYEQGVHLPVLGHRLHPFYGTYVPARMTHLELFGTWLHGYQGPRDQAADVGTGCGVLALMLARAGVSTVRATDTNPNAVESLRRELTRREEIRGVEPQVGDFLGSGEETFDLIVFNPPWTPGEPEGLLSQALYYQEGFFEGFFEQALRRLRPEGRLVMIFSNLIELVRPDAPHPIRAELERGRLREVQRLRRKVKPAPGPDGRRRRTRERVEVWELARNIT